MANRIRYTISITREFEKLLDGLADKDQITRENVICRSVGLMAALKEEVDNGGKVILQDKNGKDTELLMQ